MIYSYSNLRVYNTAYRILYINIINEIVSLNIFFDLFNLIWYKYCVQTHTLTQSKLNEKKRNEMHKSRIMKEKQIQIYKIVSYFLHPNFGFNHNFGLNIKCNEVHGAYSNILGTQFCIFVVRYRT